MIKNDYKECSDACELLYSVLKNTVIELATEGGMMDALSKGNYVYRNPLQNAIKAGANSKRLFIVAFQIALYHFDKEEVEYFVEVLRDELISALETSGSRINRFEHRKHCHNDNLSRYVRKSSTM